MNSPSPIRIMDQEQNHDLPTGSGKKHDLPIRSLFPTSYSILYVIFHVQIPIKAIPEVETQSLRLPEKYINGTRSFWYRIARKLWKLLIIYPYISRKMVTPYLMNEKMTTPYWMRKNSLSLIKIITPIRMQVNIDSPLSIKNMAIKICSPWQKKLLSKT